MSCGTVRMVMCIFGSRNLSSLTVRSIRSGNQSDSH